MPGYRIIGINHDDLADGSGKAGLTFEPTNDVLYKHIWNDTKTNVGGWRSSKLRARLNSGDLWALLPAELQSKAKAVRLLTESRGSYSSETKVIELVAKDLGGAPETLRRRRDKTDATVAAETKQSAEDAMAELKSLRAEVARLRRANEMLTTASAFFAARLDPTRR